MATTIEGALIDKLLATSKVTDLVGTSVFLRKIDQGTSGPAIALSLINRERPQAFGSDTGLVMSLFQFACWGDAKDLASVSKSLASAVVNTFSPPNSQRYRDLTGAGGIVILDCMPMGEREEFDQSVEAFGVLVDYMIHHREDAA